VRARGREFDGDDTTEPGRSSFFAVTLLGLAFLSSYTWADLNGDGYADIVIANDSSANRVCLGNGAGGFSNCTDVSNDVNKSLGVALADLDADGDLDAVFANDGQRNRVCLGNGNGGFSSCSDIGSNARLTTDVGLGDLDGDGDFDAVFGNTFGIKNRVCMGNGDGSFGGCTEIDSQGGNTFDLALADVNNDGDLDALFCNYDEANRVCLGNGNGGFSACSDLPTGERLTFDVALGDLDGDGDLDAVFANEAAANQICLNDGNGNFSDCADMDGGTRRSIGLALVDLNDDGLLDAVIGNGGGATLANEANQVCLGNGLGGFLACNDLPDGARTTRGLAVSDLNGDQQPDVIFANYDQPNRACLGNSSGDLRDCSNISGDAHGSVRLAASADLSSPPAGQFEINAGLNGNWWNGPARSGEGAQVEVADAGNGNRLFVATVYSYDTMGNQIFLIAVGPVTGNTAEVDVFITDGGMWGDNFDPALVNETQWGTGTFTASGCDAMHMFLMPNAEFQGMGYTNLAYDLMRLTTPALNCPIDISN
jgi:hypothetical protein